MASDKEDVFLDNEKPEEYVYDSEKTSSFPFNLKTKNQFDNVEH